MVKPSCHKLSLGLTTKAMACKVAGQDESPGVTLHASECVRLCEGMNIHIPKGVFISGIGLPMDSRIFKG